VLYISNLHVNKVNVMNIVCLTHLCMFNLEPFFYKFNSSIDWIIYVRYIQQVRPFYSFVT